MPQTEQSPACWPSAMWVAASSEWGRGGSRKQSPNVSHVRRTRRNPCMRAAAAPAASSKGVRMSGPSPGQPTWPASEPAAWENVGNTVPPHPPLVRVGLHFPQSPHMLPAPTESEWVGRVMADVRQWGEMKENTSVGGGCFPPFSCTTPQVAR